ncbi:MAG TPA: histidine kinase [Candidatus Limnocylindrales bacterium]
MTDRDGGPAAPVAGAAFQDLPRDGAWRPIFRSIALVFVAIPLISILTTGPDAISIVSAIVGVVVFVAILMLNTTSPEGEGFFGRPGPRIGRIVADQRRLTAVTSAAVVVLIAIAVVNTLRRPDSGWYAFFYFASTAASTIRIPRAAGALMIAAGIAAAVASFAVSAGDIGSAFLQGLSVAVIGFTVYSAIAVRRTNRALVAAREELARLAVADERARIARDLHDTLGHSLSVIALKSELAARLVDEEPDRARSEMEDVQRVARESLSSVRETIGGYRQASLATELAGARTALAAAGIEGRVEPSPEGLPPAADAILGWAVREGVTNILRHGRARVAEIRVSAGAGSAAVEISNDRAAGAGEGPGGSAVAGPGGGGGGGGTGLAGLRERVAAVGGVVEAGGLPDGGFRLRVSVPLG